MALSELGNFLDTLQAAAGHCAQHGDYEGVVLPCGPNKGQLSPCPRCSAEKEKIRQQEELRQEREQRFWRRVEQANIAPLFHSASLEGAPEPVRSFGADIRTACGYGRNLVLSGAVGTGKTHYASALALLAVGAELGARVLTIREFVLTLRAGWGKRSGDSEQEVMALLSGIDLLVLDDVGAGQCRDDEMSCVFELIDGRNKRCKATVLTTNLDKKHLRELLGERSFDRLRHRGEWATLAGGSRRGGETGRG